jgi:rod shape-determining protein MreC
MSALSHQPPPFFNRGPSAFARLTFFGLISLALLFADSHYRYLESVRAVVAVALYPLQRLAAMPREGARYIGDYFSSLQDLQRENQSLQKKLLEQAPKVQGYVALEHENDALRTLAGMEREHPGFGTFAEVLYGARDPFSQKVVIDKGQDASLKPGQAVIDEAGVVGQVTRVYAWMSEVTLVSDKDQAVPVKIQRNGIRSVLYGAGTGRPLELRFMAANADVQPGDVLVTSGIDGTYPADLAVAVVTTVERDTGLMFARISCQPAAGVDRSRHLLVLAPPAAVAPRPDATAEKDVVRKSKKRRGAERG